MERNGSGSGGVASTWTSGRIARATMTVLGVYALAAVLWMGRDVVFVAFFAALLAALLSVFVDPLQRRGLPRGLAAPLVLLGLAALLTLLGFLAWPTLQEQAPLIRRELPQAVDRARDWLEAQYGALLGGMDDPGEDVSGGVRARLASELTSIVAGAVPLLTTVAGALAGLLIIVFAGLYLAIDPRTYSDGLASLFPPHRRAQLSDALRKVGHALRMWMVGTVINMLLIGVLTTLGLMLIGVPAAFALGVIAGLLEFIPTFGPILSAVPAIAIALVVSPAHVLWVILLYIAVQQIEGNLIAPLVMKRAVNLPPALTILVQTLMTVLFGFLGLLVAVPFLAMTLVLVRELYVSPMQDHAPARTPDPG